MNAKPNLIGGIVGNSQVLACLDQQGQLVRMYWPQIDHAENVHRVVAGLFFSQTGSMTWLNQAAGNNHQYYITNTNIICTEGKLPTSGIAFYAEDFVVPDRDILVRSYRISNQAQESQQLQFYYHSDLAIGGSQQYHTTVFDFDNEALIQFRRKAYFATGAQTATDGYQCGCSWESANHACLNGNAHNMGADGTLMWDLGKLEPGQEQTITIFTCCGEHQEQVLAQLAWARGQTVQVLRENTTSFWQDYLRQAKQLNSGNAVIDGLYQRSLLVFRLLTDGKYGSILAAPEVDEHFCRSGGYAYCWVRDAAYITAAYDLAGLQQMARQFYRWVRDTQGADGSSQQRYYLDGSVAPNWGLQIDEIGSAVWGLWQHYLTNPDQDFLQECWPYVVKAVEFMQGFLEQETGLPKPSMDLWEERLGVHTYSAAAVWGGLTGAAELARLLGKQEQQQRWAKEAESLRAAILERCWDNHRGIFHRGIKLGVTKEQFDWHTTHGETGGMSLNRKGYPSYYLSLDSVVDVSLIGLTIPFGLLPADDPRMLHTVEAIEKALTSPQVGGLMRYEGDNYIGGNPWIITTLWLALYYIELKNYHKAAELLAWAAKHQTSLGLLPEQVDKHTGEPAWVIPLTWSHAMFVLTALRLKEAGHWD